MKDTAALRIGQGCEYSAMIVEGLMKGIDVGLCSPVDFLCPS